MQFLSLTMEDWVCFEGTQTLELTGRPHSPPITVIFATNGAGKTTLLNAFVWGLYGEFTGDFEHADRLLNKRAFSQIEDGVQVYVGVEITFTHCGNAYTVIRRARVERNGDTQVILSPELTLDIKSDSSGTTKASQNPQDEINQVLNRSLKDFFFFTAERMKNLTTKTNHQQVREAIRSLLRIEILERACRHTRAARGRLAKELPKDSPDGEQLAEIEAKISASEEALDKSKQQADNVDSQLAAAEAEVEERRQALLELQEVAEYQQERGKNEARIAQIDAERDKLSTGLRQRVAEDAFVPFMHDAFGIFDRLYEKALQSGQFPPPVDLHLVERLLEQEACLCEESLTSGEARRTVIETLRDQVACAEPTKDLLKDTRRELDRVRKPDDVRQRLLDLSIRRATLTDERMQLDGRNSELSAMIGKRGEDAKGAEDRLQEAGGKARNLLKRKGEAHAHVKGQQSRVTELESEREGLKKARQTVSVAARRVDVAREVETFFEQARQLRERIMRDRLVKEVNCLYQGVIIKPYKVKIGADFNLDVEDESLHSTGVSTAERAILSMSFVGALSNLAEIGPDDAQASVQREHYAVLLDAPFSNIDVLYDESLGNTLTTLSSQVIVFISPRWAPIIDQVQDHVSGAYCLHLHGADLQLPSDSTTFDWLGDVVTFATVDDARMSAVDVMQLKNC